MKPFKSRTGAVLGGRTRSCSVHCGGCCCSWHGDQCCITDGTIKKRDIGPDAVGSVEVVDGSVGMRDLS